ncbi:hypothetical protein [Empedobacter sedimenti]|uniref:hypothetical protein n=1 Tax=Empedobacter sedimenti TaxID=3042610 RepID=UPI0024A7217D|nr:hypothetical protein [Empedobacter sedimenti]
MKKLLLILTSALVLTSCIVNRQSMLVKKDIRLEMSKTEVEKQLGKPFKIESRMENSTEKMDLLYYKEALWTGNDHVTVENILIFKNDILIEIKQGKEIVDNPIVIKKDD